MVGDGTTIDLLSGLWYLSSELLLLLAAFIILGIDLLPYPRKARWFQPVTLVGLAGAFIASLTLWGVERKVFFVLSDDTFATTVKMVATFAVGLVALISHLYLEQRGLMRGPFYALLLFFTLTIFLLAAATNLILIFLALDFLSMVGYTLSGYARNDRRSSEAALKYFIYGGTISAVMIFGLSWIYGVTGTTDLLQVATALDTREVFRYPLLGETAEVILRPIVLPALIMIGGGLSFKIAAAPFHQWAPDVYEGAPTPVTALISVGPKIAGFAVLVRFTMIMLPLDLQVAWDWQRLLMAISVLTMFVGNLTALWQTNVKRLLAYSSVAQAGYILMGLVAATPRGITAVLLYLLSYLLSNLGAFAAVIAFTNETGSETIEDYAGLHQRSPLLAVALLISLLSLVGIPSTSGFIGKLWLFSSVIESGFVWLGVIAVINSAISLGYYWKILRVIYMELPPEEGTFLPKGSLLVGIILTMAGVLLLGLFPEIVLDFLDVAARTFF